MSLQTTFNENRGTEHDLANDEEFQAFQRQRSGAAADAGEMTTAPGVAADGHLTAEERDKKRREDLMRAALRASALQQELDDINESLGAANEVLFLMRNGQLDRNNDDHIQLMILAGLDPHDLDLTEDDITQRIEELEQRRDEIEGELEVIQASPDFETDESFDRQVDLIVEATAVDNEASALVDDFAAAWGSGASTTSFASDVEDNPIGNSGVTSSEFNRASNGISEERTPNVEPEAAPSFIP